MIQTVSSATKALFNQGYRQVAELTFNGTDETITITDNDLVMGSLSVDRYSVSSEQIEIGSAVAAQLDFQLDNHEGIFNNVRFEGGEVFCRIGTRNWADNEYELVLSDEFTLAASTATALSEIDNSASALGTSIKVTLNGTEYICPRAIDSGIVVYGSRGGDYSVYPFKVFYNSGWKILVPTAGTYKIIISKYNTAPQIVWIPIGYFLIDQPPRALSTIHISALDRMVLFNKEITLNSSEFPMTVETLVNRCCSDCNVTSAVDFTNMVNRGYEIASLPDTTTTEEVLTYRTLLQWCAQILGGNAFMDYNGQLQIKWYESTTALTITPSMRYLNGGNDIYENSISITGISFTDTEGTTTLTGEDGYVIDISDNLLIQGDPSDVLDGIFETVGGFTYTQFNASVKPSPFLWAMDSIIYVGKNGEEIVTTLTNANHRLNGATAIAAKGETQQTYSYAGGNGLTRQQSKVIEKMVGQNVDVKITNAQQAALNMNQLIANSLGLYLIEQETTSGTIYYYCNQPTLANSTIIYTFTENGFAWTSSWNSGNPTWDYGITKDGNAVLKALTAYKVVADVIEGGTLTLGREGNSAGQMEIYDETNRKVVQADNTGIEVYGADGSKVVMNPSDGFAGYDKIENGTKIYWAAKQEFHMKNAQVENEFTLAATMRYMPIETSSNRGIGLVPYVGGES